MTNRRATKQEIKYRQALREVISNSEFKEPRFSHIFYFAIIVVCVFGLASTIFESIRG